LNKDVAKEYNIPTSTLATSKKNKKIIEAFENSFLKRQRRVKTDKYDKLNDALFKWWFKSMRGNNIPINGSILSEKAHEFAKAFQYADFAASNGWLRGWKEITYDYLSSMYLYCIQSLSLMYPVMRNSQDIEEF